MMVMIVNNSFRLPMNRNQVTIRTMMYPEIHPPSQEISDEVFQANHSIQYKENLENFSNPNQEKEEPPQESDIHQLIKECCTEVFEEQKKSMEDTMLELVKICQEKEFLCIHDNEVKNVVEQPAERGNRNIQSLQNFRVVHKSSISFKNTSQISSVHAIAPILSTKKPEHSLSMGYEHLSITPEMESDEVTESNADNLLPIPSECEVTLEDKRECDVPISENTPVCDDHSEIFSDSKIDDDISVYDDDFKDIEYVEASLSDPQINDIYDDSSNDSLLEEADLFLSDNLIPQGIENVDNDSEGDVRFLKELLINDSILSHEILILRITRQFHDLLQNHQMLRLIQERDSSRDER
uniref:Reverse transcriptase domain-containing protein n=1 Tax=Tanacetum cinerariifolium TaxID=118510 RepID=A0A699GVT9_TANCI|nr:hypothetical protein [Tanacetum cinerariifolium]